MKKIIFFSLFFICSNLYAEDFVCSDGGTKFINYVHSIDPSKINDLNCFIVDETKIGQQLDILKTIPQKYLKVENSLIVEMTQPEKDAVDAQSTQNLKNIEIARIDNGDVSGKEILNALDAIVKASLDFKGITSVAIKEKIKEQEGLQ